MCVRAVRDAGLERSDPPFVSHSSAACAHGGDRLHLPSGLVTICGGKWTTYRMMAEDAVDKTLELNAALKAKAKPCETLTMKLIGSDRSGLVCDQKFDRCAPSLSCSSPWLLADS